MSKVIISIWIVLLFVTGFSPHDRITWLMEVFPVLVAIPILFLTERRFPLPRYILLWILVHGIVLMVGGHYTYAEVPVGFWIKEVFDFSRNHFDRLGHFLQGFVPALIIREILLSNYVISSKAWRFFITVTICMAVSVTYEFIEWGAALTLGQGADAFLGTQGDPWDTQWDLFLATIGAVTAQIIYRGNKK